MKLIHDVIKENRRFVGRDKELFVMEQMLSSKKEEWSMIHFYGPSGIGKTALLKQFEQRNTHVPVLYIDGHKGFQSAQELHCSIQNQLLDKNLLEEASFDLNITSALKHISREHDAIVLMLDGMDSYCEMMAWIKEEFLKRLPVNVKVFSAGRFPLHDWQHEFGWETIIRNIQIKAFSREEWTQYAKICGITDDRLLYQIGVISQGIPFAVSQTCHRILEKGNRGLLDETDCRILTETFDQILLSEENLSGVNTVLLALSSLPYTFDQEMLEYMLDQPIPSSEFTQLCQSAFVQTHPSGGWMIKHGVRRWARASLKERFPDKYEQYKKRAEDILERRKPHGNKEQKTWKLELAISKFLLQENEYAKSVVYRGDHPDLRARTAKKEEIPLLAEMYQKNIQVSPPFLTDDSHQEQYLHQIWEAEPSAIQVIENDEQILGFYVLVPLNKEICAILQNNPMTRKWIANARFGQQSQDRFFWMLSAYPALEWEIIDFFLYHSFLPILYEQRVTCLIWSKDQAQFLQLLGFEHLDDADFRTPSGLQYYFYHSDPDKAADLSSETSVLHRDHELEDWMELTKKLLSAYPALQRQQPLLNQCRQLWGAELETEDIASRIQEIIKRQLQWLKEGSRQEKVQAQILQHAYLNRKGSHEAVAAWLNLPASTYYRQLKKLIRTIAYILQNQTL